MSAFTNVNTGPFSFTRFRVLFDAVWPFVFTTIWSSAFSSIISLSILPYDSILSSLDLQPTPTTSGRPVGATVGLFVEGLHPLEGTGLGLLGAAPVHLAGLD